MKIIVTGMIATFPVGGVAWDYGQYALGLEQLGHEVFYLEDTGLASYSPDAALYLDETLTRLSPSLHQKWHYRSDDGQTYGINKDKFADIVKSADVFINVSGGCLLRDEYMACPRKVLIDTDPGLNHFVNYPKWDNNMGWPDVHSYRKHDHFFTYAENIGQADCVLPSLGINWGSTRPLIVMDCWKSDAIASNKWTTVIGWNPYKHYKQPIEYQGKVYGDKEMEFEKIERIPSMCSAAFEIAVGGKDVPKQRWEGLGWQVIDAEGISRNTTDYRDYLINSRGEFSVAKNVYVATRSGWFSCRSICYMAAGRPVVVQDTGFSKFIPTGDGVIAFTNLDEAVKGVETVEKNYAFHCKAAQEIAREYFSSEVVLKQLLKDIGLG